MNVTATREGVLIALDSLRANKLRAALAILGIVIGVATVMAMASMIAGIRGAVMNQLEALGPENFVVERFDQTQIQLFSEGNDRPPWEGKPPITLAEARLIESLPAIESVTTAVSLGAELRVGSASLPGVSIRGRGHLWTEYERGDFIAGRNFLPAEERSGALVAVLSEAAAESLFPSTNPVGQYVRIGVEQFRVIGVHREAANPFTSPESIHATVPTTTAIQRLRASPDWMSLLVVPAAGYTQAEAMDQVTGALRSARGLPPAAENNFALIRQEAFARMFDNFTWAFFLVMLVLSSIGLMVGGVGVVAIMMISVTERTREIGLRKALGATKREILWQFLVESVTITLVGGALGVAIGAAGAAAIGGLTPIPATVPAWSIAAALAVSALGGIGFGLYPASRAARLDPVEALRYE